MIARNTVADINVISLIGERGRELKEFIEKDLGPEGLARSVVVVSTSDESSQVRLNAAYVGTAIAEYFRDQGKSVILMMDSVTRFARALREVGLAAGEPPARAGYTPSVFSTLPKLLERAGNSDKGSITGFYTILVAGDDMNEPVADEVRSSLDGHIILSADLARRYHYPAVDVLASASRCLNSITEKKHQKLIGTLREVLADYKKNEMLIKIGEYKRGSDKAGDFAIDHIDAVNNFLKQQIEEAEALVKQREKELEDEREKLRLAEAERDKVAQHLEDKVMQLRQELDEGTTTDKIISAKRYIEVVQEKLQIEEEKVLKQKEAVSAAEARLEDAKEQVKERRKEVEKIQTHKKEWLKEQMAEIERLEQLEMDEIGQIIHLTRMREHNAQG
jgi:F0F1-type ATP synthase beta subunit